MASLTASFNAGAPTTSRRPDGASTVMPESVCRLSTSRLTGSRSPCSESLYRPGPDSPPLHSWAMDPRDGGERQRLLIGEDEQPLAQAMARTLRSRGFEADIALSGAEARQRFEAVDYALVLMDIRLPDESGYGLLGELNKKVPQPAVVMISGVDDPELGRAAVDHGAYGYYVKPVGATELYLATVNALRRRSLEIEYRANLEGLQSMVAERADQMARAAALQAGMLPASPLKGKGFEIAAHFTPAREISGDFYDWHQTDPRFISVTLGDVMGKVLPAAIMMATVRAALRGSVQREGLEEGVQLAARV